MNLPRIVFLSSPPYGELVCDWLRQSNLCDLVRTVIYDGKLRPITFDYDIGLGFLYSWKIPSEEVLTHPWINWHPAPLPEYGGRNVSYHAIMEEATEFGATVHYMSPSFDTGDIIEVRKYPILPTDNAGDLADKSKRLLVEMFKDWVPKLLKGKVPSAPQNGKTRYYAQRKLDEGVYLSQQEEKLVRALTNHPKFHAKVMIQGRSYSLVPTDSLR